MNIPNLFKIRTTNIFIADYSFISIKGGEMYGNYAMGIFASF